MVDTPPEWGKRFLPREIAKLCYQANWTDAQRLLIAVSICIAESNGYEHRIHENRDAQGNLLSTDRGIWMINDVAYPNASDEIAYDAVKATRFARQIYVGRDNKFTAWAAFNNGQYKGERAMGYAFDGIANFLRLQNGYKIP